MRAVSASVYRCLRGQAGAAEDLRGPGAERVEERESGHDGAVNGCATADYAGGHLDHVPGYGVVVAFYGRG